MITDLDAPEHKLCSDALQTIQDQLKWAHQRVKAVTDERDKLRAENEALRNDRDRAHAAVGEHKAVAFRFAAENERLRKFVRSLAECPAAELDVEMIVAAASTVLAAESESAEPVKP